MHAERYNTCSRSSIRACAMVHYDFKSPTGARILRPARSDHHSRTHPRARSSVGPPRAIFSRRTYFSLSMCLHMYVCVSMLAVSQRRCNTFTIASGEWIERCGAHFPSSPDFGEEKSDDLI